MNVTTIMKMPSVFLQRKLWFLHYAHGGVRWRSTNRQAPLLTAVPVRALIDENISIEGRFLYPHCPVTVCAHINSEDGDLWEAFAHYNTSSDGTVNLSRDHSSGGSYLGCEPMGLFWGLEPAPGAREGLRLRKKNVETPYVMHISLREGHVSPSEGQSTELAAVTTERWYMAPGVQRVEIRQNGLVGTLFLPPELFVQILPIHQSALTVATKAKGSAPPDSKEIFHHTHCTDISAGPGPFPAMLDLWGFGGGLVEYRSALFASRGYASLSLAYLGHKELPGSQNSMNVGDSYFRSAFHLLQDHPQICADRVGILGLSFGVYLALRMATQAEVEPACLICINGPVGSTMKLLDAEGKTEMFESAQQFWSFDDQGRVLYREATMPANLVPESIVKIEHLACPLLYILGEDDLSASSIENANLIEETLRAAGKSHLFTCRSYPGAGHLIEPPYTPNARASLWRVKPKKIITLWGGHPAPHAAAQEHAWKEILDFMESNLRQ